MSAGAPPASAAPVVDRASQRKPAFPAAAAMKIVSVARFDCHSRWKPRNNAAMFALSWGTSGQGHGVVFHNKTPDSGDSKRAASSSHVICLKHALVISPQNGLRIAWDPTHSRYSFKHFNDDIVDIGATPPLWR